VACTSEAASARQHSAGESPRWATQAASNRLVAWLAVRWGGGPEGLVLGLVVAPVLERIFGDHRAGEAQVGGALQLLDPVLDVVQVDDREALQSGGIGAAESLYARKMADISSGSASLK
jgi:hypothetical protein